MTAKSNQGGREPVSVILIAHNEAATVREEVEAFYRVIVEKLPGSELIVTEDGSTDGTGEIIRELSASLSFRLVQGRERKGYKKALLDALRLPGNEWIFFSDTGGKFDPEDFWSLEKLRSGADLIIGVKKKREDQLYRRFLTGVFNAVVRAYFRVPVHDIDSGLRLFRRDLILKVIEEPLLFNDMIACEITLRMLALGARLGEVPVVYHSRRGKSRGMPPEKIPRVVFQVLSAFPRLKMDLVRLKEGRRSTISGKE